MIRRDSRKRADTSGMVIAFSCNQHDNCNYDMDLLLPPSLEEKYQTVIKNKYTYTENDSPTIYEGTTYRCRLRGVWSQLSHNRNRESKELTSQWFAESRAAYIKICQTFDRSGGWALVKIYGTDVYNRLLVDVFDPISGKNIADLLVSERTRKSRESCFFRMGSDHSEYSSSSYENRSEW